MKTTVSSKWFNAQLRQSIIGLRHGSCAKFPPHGLHVTTSCSSPAIQCAFVSEAHDRTQASFVQISALKELSLIPAEAKKTIDLFLTQNDEGLAVSAPEVNMSPTVLLKLS